MTSDLDLLRQFTRENSQASFGEIVRRHLNLVYSAALRQVRSPQLAEEIAQSVFTDLARHAGKMSTAGVPPANSLTPWLYAVTRRTAIDAIRKESRRQLREQIAVEMNDMNATESSAGVSPAWSEIESFLDDAMESLDETDRSAVLLRFFENKSLREVGEALGTSEDAAQKRVSRAVERLREFFSRQKITIGASGLAVLVSANAVQSAPVGLAVTVSATALAGTALSTSTAIAATKIIAMTTLQKAIIGTALVAAVGAGVFEAHQASQLRQQVQTLQQQQAPLTEQIRQLQREHDELTNEMATLRDDKDQQKLRIEHLELLSLRGRVSQLVDELRQRNAGSSTPASPEAGSEAANVDSILFSASLTNRVATGQMLVLGGWSLNGMRADPLNGMRTYLLITPTIQNGDITADSQPIIIKSQIVAAPNDFWNQIGWQEAKSDTRRSLLAGVLSSDEAATLLAALKETQGAIISNSSLAKRRNGEYVGIGYSRKDDNGDSGMVMSVELIPRITPDGQAVTLEISPSPTSSNIPIYPLLK